METLCKEMSCYLRRLSASQACCPPAAAPGREQSCVVGALRSLSTSLPWGRVRSGVGRASAIICHNNFAVTSGEAQVGGLETCLPFAAQAGRWLEGYFFTQQALKPCSFFLQYQC